MCLFAPPVSGSYQRRADTVFPLGADPVLDREGRPDRDDPQSDGRRVCGNYFFENASFRVPIRRRRCLIPVSGFFGWHHGQAQKTPYYVTVKDRPVIALAGVFDCWIDRDSDEVVMTYSVITTEANPMMRHVNNRDCRMPVILHDGDEERWLHPELSDGQIAALLKPYPEQMMVCEPAQPDFMRKVSGDSGILMPA